MPEISQELSSGVACIHHLFEDQAKRTPNSAAIVSAHGTVTYRALNARADALALGLRLFGVQPEALVGLYMEKSPDMVAGILAVLKAGGAYVPMDPRSPLERMTKVPLHLVLTEGRHLAPELNSLNCPVLCADDVADVDHQASPAAQRDVGTGRPCRPADLAYVIYTSGSTGEPKGVAVEHRSLVHSTLARSEWYQPPRAFLLLSAMAFDSTVAGIFGTLTRGGALHLPASGTEADVLTISQLIDANAIDATLVLPSLYDLLLEAADPRSLRSLRTVTVAGERCPATLPAKSHSTLPHVELYNEYGPAEATVWSTVWHAPESGLADLDTVPIGRPIAGTRISVVDESGRPLPEGEKGELCISGPGLARGYHGRPDLTARAFEPDPHGAPGERRYRTGDLARRRPGGELEFLGRIDRQLKVRGHRVEPGEVEDAMSCHPGVRQAVVVADKRRADVGLAAFFTGDPVDPPELQRFLRGKLPAYMVPTRIRRIDSLPTTEHGKIDLQALEKDVDSDEPDAPGGTGSHPVEELVTCIWRDVFGVPGKFEPSRSFFDIGSSLDSVRIAVHLSHEFGSDIPMLWVYEARTLEQLCAWITENVADAEAMAEKRLRARREASDHAQ